MSETRLDPYAGDIHVSKAWHILESDPNSVLIDVRTHAEWSYVGVPDLGSLHRDVLLVEWLSYPAMQVHTDFGERLEQDLKSRSIKPDAPLLFLCRSGVRSRDAAIVMTGRWAGPCFNVAGGFEGDLDEAGHRSRINGWKNADLPWRQF